MPRNQTPIHIVAITGQAGAGKDTAANALRACGWPAIAYADAIRAECCENWRIDDRYFTTRHCKEQPFAALSIDLSKDYGFCRWVQQNVPRLTDESPCEVQSNARTPRWIMQHWGDYKRRFNTYYWSEIAARNIARTVAAGNRSVVITDLRMPWEALHLQATAQSLGQQYGVPHRLTVLRIVRPDQTTTSTHPTETHIPKIQADHTLINDSTIVALSEQILQAVGVQMHAEGEQA